MKRPRPRHILLALTLCTAILVVVEIVLARGLGDWLVAVDPLVTSDAIFVLDGKSPHRDLEAAALYRDGWAPRVVVARPRSDLAEDVRREFGLETEQEQVARTLGRAGVPESAIVRLERVVENTEGELTADFDYAKAQGFRRVILVSSPYHTRRIRIIWRRHFEREIAGLVRATRYERVDPARWWRSRRSLEDVAHETAGIANFLLGAPLPTFDRAD
jgi:uncharacterized SAM-binding protein YcdF (DUF218 family)